MIHAEVHTDDHHITASFDATLFFERATLGEIVALKEIGWGGDHPSDAVAIFMLEQDAEVSAVFRYLDSNPDTHDGLLLGFECHLAEDEVACWVREHRPAWFEYLWPRRGAAAAPRPRVSLRPLSLFRGPLAGL